MMNAFRSSSPASLPNPRRFASRGATLLLLAGLLMAVSGKGAQAAPPTNTINLVPKAASVSFSNALGQFVASGTASATIHKKSTTVPFAAPLALAGGATPAGATCPILNLQIAPINLDLLGLQVQTSSICLSITGEQNGGLLGSLLCSVAGLLNQGVPLSTIVNGLTSTQLSTLTSGLLSLVNGALTELSSATLQSVQAVNSGHTCSILHLSLAPINLTLLGLNVALDNCNGGAVTVDITAVTGQGNLLGNILCDLVGGNGLSIGSTLQSIVQQILGQLGL